MITLKNTGVEFIDSTHKYFLNGKELQGITHIIKSMLFPDMYKDVPTYVLNNAAAKGSAVHEQIELVDSLGVEASLPEVKAYVKMKKDLGYETVANEYIVTDFDSFASGIDLVVHQKDSADNEVELWDIKHTYNVHKPYVEWQLSIYKAWFEAINPDLKVTAIKCLWLRDDRTRGLIHQLIPLNPHTKDEVNMLFKCAKEGKPYGGEKKPGYVTDVEEYEEKIIFLENSIKTMTDELNDIKTKLMDSLTKANQKSVDTGRILVTCKDGSKRSSFDTKAFKEADGELYDKLFDKYHKDSVTKGSLTIKIKEQA